MFEKRRIRHCNQIFMPSTIMKIQMDFEPQVFDVFSLNPSLRVDPLFKRRKGLRNNEQKLATVSSRLLEYDLSGLC